MAVEYMNFWWNFDNFAFICLGTVTHQGFLKSLITNLRSESQNSKWRIQYGGQVHDVLWNFDNFARIRLGTVIRGFLRSLIMNLRSESENSKWRIQYGDLVHDFFWDFNNLRLGMVTRGGFEVADNEYEIKNGGSNMAVEYMNFWWNFDSFALICLGTVTLQGFLKSSITNLRSGSQNSKWRIQYGGQVHDFLWNVNNLARIFGKFCNRPVTEILTSVLISHVLTEFNPLLTNLIYYIYFFLFF